jgi:Fe-S-cluster containining protein
MTEPEVVEGPYRPRCRGQCCKAFTLTTSVRVNPWLLARMGEVWTALAACETDAERDPIVRDAEERLIPLVRDADVVADMVIWLGEFSANPLTGAPVADGQTQDCYTCKNLQPNGDCGVYEDRPALCRSYGVSGPCEYALCACRPLLTG